MIDNSNEIFTKILGAGNKPSKAQLEIIDFVAHGIGNATVQSRAGSGKSKTIELAVSFIPSNKKVLIVSYNKHIAQHLLTKFKDMKNVHVCTYHSLGYKILASKFKDKFNGTLEEDKYRNYITANIQMLSDNIYETLDGVNRWCYKKNLERLTDYARYNKAQSVKEIQKVALQYKMVIIANECKAVRNILRWGSEHIDTFDYVDLIWLPYELGIPANMPNLLYDMIFVDEAQDSSLIQQSLLDVCKKRNTRFLAFGDSQQTINAWCGSDAKAFANFGKQANTKKFHLNMSYRCSKTVAEKVKTIIPDFEVPDNAIIGSVNQLVKLENAKEGDLILSRMTAPLINVHLNLIKQGKPSKVNGVNLGYGLINTIKDTNETEMSKVLDVLYKSLITTWEELKEQYNCSLKEVISERQLIEQYDEILSIEALSEGLNTVDEVLERINTIFPKSGNDVEDVLDDKHIHLSTVHRAKGLEADNVYIICPSLMPSKLATEDWEKDAEKNLIYVAWSRAKNSLNFVDEKSCRPPKSYGGVEELYNAFLEIKRRYEKN